MNDQAASDRGRLSFRVQDRFTRLRFHIAEPRLNIGPGAHRIALGALPFPTC
ncbi:MAG TPA: hypothetical protein VED46_05870 [Alphaproteobacteria bacterium]|nr:hypothetical protein [Alphaproteobacteria bacterium]